MKPKRHSSGKVLATLLLTASTLVLLGFGSFASATTSSDLSSAPANSTVQADETEDTGTNGSTSTPNPGPGEVPSSTSEEPQGESTPGEDESTDSSNTEVDSSAQPEEEEGTAPMEPYGISPQALSNIRDYPEFTPITDGVEFKFSDANGNPVDPDQVHVGDDFTLSFDLNFTPELWAAIQAGDYYDIEMPDGFEIAFANGPFLILGPGPDFKVLATIEETPDGMRLVFTDAFKEAPVTEGEFYVTGKVAQEVGDGAGNIEVEFPTEENLPPTNITVRPDTTDSIDKQGYFDRTPNPNQVTWTVNANKQVDTLNGFTVTDTLPPGLSVSGDSDIVVYKYTMGFDGNPVSGSKVPLSNPGDYTIEYDTDGNPKVVFNGTVDYPVEITYTTTIEPASKPDGAGTISYENKVSTTADEISEDISASATVVGRWVDSLEKELENYDPESQQFSWLVHYNYRGDTIATGSGFIVDNFDAGMQLVGYGNDPTTAGNFVLMPREYVNGVLVDKHPALVEPNDYSIVRKGDGFEIIFNKAIDYPIDIRYKTEVTDIVDENTVYGNTVTDGTHTDNGDGSADQQNVVKTHTVDPATNTITWLIYINLNRYEMNNFRLKDVISVGQKFGNPDDLIITDIDDTNKVLTYGQDYTAIMSTPTMSITFRPPYDNTNHAFTIQYTTRYDGTQADVFANTATSHWTGSDGKDHGSTDTDSYTPTSEEQENGAKEGTYNATTKEITWVIRINYNDIELINARVTDTLAANQTYVADSLKVYTYTQQAGTGKPLRGSELTAAQYAALTTWTEPTAANGKTLVIGLPDAAGGASAYYWIEYKTSLEGEIIGTEAFTNTAQWHNGATGDFDLNASVSVANGGSYVGKQGMVGADGYMHWTVTVNQSQSTLSDVVITDTPDSNQLVDVDSIVVYPTTVAANGNVSIDQSASPLVLGQDYMVSYKADNSGVYTLVIKFIGAYETISRPYIIDFKVTVIAGSAPSMELTNDAVITGTGKEEIYQPGSGSSTVTVGNGGGWLRGPSGAAILHKVDSVTGQPIPGVTFQLYFDNSGVQGGPYGPPRTTNSNGDIIFLDLQYGDYWLEEITQLPGYSYMNPNPQKITLSSSGATVTYRIENDPSYLVLTKVDSENHGALEGVKYDLYRKNGSYTLYQSGLVTNAGGQLVLSALPKGEYYLVETDHLPGYWAEPDPIYFAIERDNTSGELTSTFLNGDGGIPTGNTYTHENRPTRITVRKWDEHGAAGGNALSGASFILEQLVGGNWGQLNPGTFYTSQQNGEIEVTYLPAGTYRFIEVSAPVGYARHTVPLQFTIAEDGTVDIIRDFENWPVIVILHKVDASTGESLSGAIFWLYEYDELAQEWARIRTDETFYTDDNGILTISKLNLNTHYRLVEVTAPAGYSLNGEAIEFDLKPGSITDIEVFDVGDWPNIPSEAALVKTDEESGGALEGAVFKLERYDENAGIWSTYKEGLTTNVNGGISIDGMPAGRYRFIETEAPIGYLLDATPHEFTLATDTNGRIVPARVDVTNRKIEMQPTGAVQTGDNTNLVLWAILGGLSLLGLGVVLVFVWRLRRKQ